MLYFTLCVAAFPLLIFVSYISLLFVAMRAGWTASVTPSPESSAKAKTLDLPLSYSILIVVRGIGETLLDKLESISRLECQETIVDVLIGLDGACTSFLPDHLKSRLEELETRISIRYIESPAHLGKNAVINKMLPLAKGAVLLFTDVDAIVKSNTLLILSRWFEDPAVGAVAGLRVIDDEGKFGTAQGAYVDFDTQIKNMEMHFMGSVTSCDGKLYAIRSTLADSIPLHVTDDTFIGLGAPLQNKRLVFDTALVASIGRPAKNPVHEFDRRRRVTTRGLHSLIERRALFRTTRYGWYSYCLFANKVCRRFAPVSLALVSLLTAFALGFTVGVIALLLILLLVLASFGYLAQGGHEKLKCGTGSSVSIPVDQVASPTSFSSVTHSKIARPMSTRLIAASAYFLLGMSAMTLGTLDFICGKKVSKWEPRKSV